jgi:NADH:ubiquinone oxidoreductase subunit C
MITNFVSPGAKFVENQAKVTVRLTEKYSTDRKLEFDKLNEPVLWAKSVDDAHMLVKMFMLDESTKVDFLSDLTAYDNEDGEDGNERFVLVYNLYSTELHTRIRIKCLVGLTEQAVSIVDLFLGANWLEREVYDMYGISFKNHPNMRRILMDERFAGHPLRKEYPIKQRQPFNDNIRLHLGGNPLKVETQTPNEEK